MSRALVAAILLAVFAVQSAYADDLAPDSHLAPITVGLNGVDVPEPVAQVAAESGTDVIDLLGAVNSTGLDPAAYLCRVGEGPCPIPPPKPVVAVAPAPATVGGVWTALAQCESTSNWAANTGNGFYGGLQFDYGTWLAYGGGAYAPTANRATAAQQVAIAQKVAASRGFAPWPACSRKLGLR